jgi:serine phosphatase RsbU (regulator of sigma subunit)/pSer/pThr/pTyr-binding forkhead associated (FHA) protein
MAEVKLKIYDHGKSRRATLNAKGTIIGRSSQCDIKLESDDVSRKHARIFQDPFERWIIEDLGSHNGILIDGKRVEAYALLPGEQVIIGSFTLSIEPSVTQQIERDKSVQINSLIIKDDFKIEIVSDEVKTDKILSRAYFKQLNNIDEHLSDLTSPSDLYPEVCKCLASGPKMVAAVLRLPENTKELPKSPEILACCLGSNPSEATTKDMTNLCLSRRTLEAVRTTGNAVMAQSTHSSDADMVLTLTISDQHRPRAVICSPLSDVTEVVYCLYIDMPLDQTPDDTFDFVRAVSREVVLTRKSLIFMQAKAESQKLNEQLSLAHDIQSKLTATWPEGGFGVDLAVRYKPAMWVGGDYYDVWTLENGQIAFAVADVSGKGLPAAMIMSNMQAALRTTMNFCTELSTVVEYVNRHLCQNLRDDMFVTAFVGLFDPNKNTLSYVNAGHILPLIMLPSENPKPLGKATNPPLGIMERHFEMSEDEIPPETALLVVTDGITEAISPDGDLFETERLAKSITEAQVHSAQELVNSVINAVADFRQTMAQHDDVTVLALVNRKTGPNKDS